VGIGAALSGAKRENKNGEYRRQRNRRFATLPREGPPDEFLRQFNVALRPLRKLPFASIRPSWSVPARSITPTRDPSERSSCKWMSLRLRPSAAVLSVSAARTSFLLDTQVDHSTAGSPIIILGPVCWPD
jgi:hypothetical protein